MKIRVWVVNTSVHSGLVCSYFCGEYIFDILPGMIPKLLLRLTTSTMIGMWSKPKIR